MLYPLTFILSPVIGGEGRVRGRNNMKNVPLLLRSSIEPMSRQKESVYLIINVEIEMTKSVEGGINFFLESVILQP
jgi:hypothetical protein